jgi:hypothetical protein
MVIEHPRRERADHVTAHLKGLVDRRRLVHRAGDRLEIRRVEREGVEVSIPTECVEGMMRMNHARQAGAILDQHLHVLLRIDREHFGWPMEIALGVR